MKKYFLTISAILLASFLLAQSIDQKIYREVTRFGFGSSAFRDLATSPLTYEGAFIAFSRGKWKTDSKKEIYFGREMQLGFASVAVEETNSNSFFLSTSINYTRIYSLQRFAKNGWEYKVGGKLDALLLVRTNTDFGNNTLGFDAFPTLFGSFKVVKSFERHPFLKRKKAAQNQSLSFTIDLGILNSTFRNDFAYTSHTPFYNDKNLLKDYQFQSFNGLRIKTAIDYIIYSNKNNNAVKVSYKWEGLHSGKTRDRFAMSTVFFQFSLLHRLN